jgi:hypothetical protein
MQVDEKVAAVYPELVLRHSIIFESRLAKSCHAMKLPVMPGAFDVIALDHSTPKGPTNVVANV